MNNLVKYEEIKLKETVFKIPARTKELLYISFYEPPTESFRCGMPINITFDILTGEVKLKEFSLEPSTIYIKMPIRNPNGFDIPRPSYYPTYAGLSPEQKWIYLNWLKDITGEINIGYVFIYYYGLERHLVLEKFDLAFDKIMLLREYHKNSSFISYSNHALIYACILRKRMDRVKEIKIADDTDNNIELLMLNLMNHDLEAQDLVRIFKRMPDLNKRYIKNNPDLYLSALKNQIKNHYGTKRFPFYGRYNIAELKQRQTISFANISFPSHIRLPHVPELFNHGPFKKEIINIHNITHEEVKNILKSLKKKE
jgi:hypothetical protein